ncbi:MAG TPA: hypothetical protein ENN21_04885, partial [Spirochaetes bacterium]|nr:hypothetical protein [Spirochaetota bacterium]
MKTGTHRLVILAAAALLLAALAAVVVPPAAAAGNDITGPFSEIRQGFRDMKESLEGVGRFFKALHSITGAVTSVIDPSAIILLLVVLFLSSGFASIGVPRGRASFTVSLIAVDSVSFLWKRSMNPESLSFL